MKITLRELRLIIKKALVENSNTVQSVMLSSEVDQALRGLLNAAASELKDLDKNAVANLVKNKQAVTAWKKSVSDALKSGLESALSGGEQTQQQKPKQSGEKEQATWFTSNKSLGTEPITNDKQKKSSGGVMDKVESWLK